MILDCIISPPGQDLSNFSPLVTMDPMSIYECSFLLQCPSIFFYIGIQMIVPPLTTLLPYRPGNDLAMTDHFIGPYLATSSMILSSSSRVHGLLTRSGLRTFCHRCRHCTSDLSGKNSVHVNQYFDQKSHFYVTT